MQSTIRTLLAGAALTLSLPLFMSSTSAISTDAAEIQLQVANLLFSDGRYIEAFDAYDHVATSDDLRVRRRALMGSVRSSLRLAEFARAGRDADALIKIAPRDAEAIALLGDSLWSLGLFDEAEQKYNDALGIQSELPRALHGLARALASRGRLEEALDQAQMALRYAPRDGEIHHTVGSIYERMGRFEEAANAYGSYVNLLPNRDRSAQASWSRAEIRFLKAFGRKTPFEMDEADAKTLYTVPFKIINEKVVVRAKVNNGPLMDFVLDTGSEQTVVTTETARRLGVHRLASTLSAGVGDIGLRALDLGRLDSFEIGNLKIRNVPAIVKNPPLRGLPTRETESFSPLSLGLSMIIDYGTQQLIIGRELPSQEADVELPLRLHRLAMVPGKVDGGPASFIIDTGGQVISISLEAASELDRPSARHIPLQVYGMGGWDRDAFLLPGVNLGFRQIEYRNFSVVVLNLRAPSILLGFRLGGIVGHKFLSQYRVAIDLNRSVVRLKARPGFPAPAPAN